MKNKMEILRSEDINSQREVTNLNNTSNFETSINEDMKVSYRVSNNWLRNIHSQTKLVAFNAFMETFLYETYDSDVII